MEVLLGDPWLGQCCFRQPASQSASQHLHYVLLCEQEGLNVHLFAHGAFFCTAEKTIAFVSLLSERPGPFSLFCCTQTTTSRPSGRVGSETTTLSMSMPSFEVAAEEVGTHSTTGLNDKDASP